jgi:hypothetical protein
MVLLFVSVWYEKHKNGSDTFKVWVISSISPKTAIRSKSTDSKDRGCTRVFGIASCRER